MSRSVALHAKAAFQTTIAQKCLEHNSNVQANGYASLYQPTWGANKVRSGSSEATDNRFMQRPMNTKVRVAGLAAISTSVVWQPTSPPVCTKVRWFVSNSCTPLFGANRRTLWLLGVVVCAAIGVRCWGITERSLWFDEAFSWRVSTFPYGELIERTGRDNHPPLHFLLLKWWTAAFGESELAIRMLSVVAGAASCVGMFLLVREAFGSTTWADENSTPCRMGTPARPSESTGRSAHPTDDLNSEGLALLAAALVAVSVFQIRWGWEGRMYALGTALATFSSWSLWRALRKPEGGWLAWIIYGILALAFVYTHYYAVLTVAAQVLFAVGYLGRCAWGRTTDANEAKTPHPNPLPAKPGRGDLIVPLPAEPGRGDMRESFPTRPGRGDLSEPLSLGFAPRQRLRWGGLGLSLLIVVVGFLPWTPWLLHQRAQIQQAFWARPLEWESVPLVLYQMFVEPEDATYNATANAIATIATVSVLAVLLWRPTAGDWFLFLGATVPMLGSVLVSLLDTRIFHLRYFLFCHLFLLAVLARAVWKLCPHRLERSLVSAWLLVTGAMIDVAFLERLDILSCPGVKGATAWIAESRRPGEPVVVCSPLFFFPVLYHLPGRSDCFLFSDGQPVVHYEGGSAVMPQDLITTETLSTLRTGRVWVINMDGGHWGTRTVPVPAHWRLTNHATFLEAYGVQGTAIVDVYETHAAGS